MKRLGHGSMPEEPDKLVRWILMILAILALILFLGAMLNDSGPAA